MPDSVETLFVGLSISGNHARSSPAETIAAQCIMMIAGSHVKRVALTTKAERLSFKVRMKTELRCGLSEQTTTREENHQSKGCGVNPCEAKTSDNKRETTSTKFGALVL